MNRKNNRIELIISLVAVAGHARRVLSENIQRNLFRLGYKWNYGEGKPQNLDAAVLHVNSPDWNPTHITFEDEGPACTSGAAMVFDAITGSEEFLAAAKDALIAKRVIEGVEVTITPNDVKLDATALLTRAGAEARRIQLELFGG